MCSQTVRVVTLSVPTHGDPCSRCCSTTQQFHRSSPAMPEMHHMPRTKLQSTAVCVAFCRIALQAWLLNQDTPSLPPALFSLALVQLVSSGCQVFPAPGPSVQWFSWFYWVFCKAVQSYTITQLHKALGCSSLFQCMCFIYSYHKGRRNKS